MSDIPPPPSESFSVSGSTNDAHLAGVNPSSTLQFHNWQPLDKVGHKRRRSGATEQASRQPKKSKSKISGVDNLGFYSIQLSSVRGNTVTPPQPGRLSTEMKSVIPGSACEASKIADKILQCSEEQRMAAPEQRAIQFADADGYLRNHEGPLTVARCLQYSGVHKMLEHVLDFANHRLQNRAELAEQYMQDKAALEKLKQQYREEDEYYDTLQMGGDGGCGLEEQLEFEEQFLYMWGRETTSEDEERLGAGGQATEREVEAIGGQGWIEEEEVVEQGWLAEQKRPRGRPSLSPNKTDQRKYRKAQEKPITLQEVQDYVAMSLHASVVCYKSIKMFYETGDEFWVARLSEKRFRLIHFCIGSDIDIMENLIETTIAANYTPSKRGSTDESCTPSCTHWGPHHMYVASKPHKNVIMSVSSADKNKIVLCLHIRRRIQEDPPPLAHQPHGQPRISRADFSHEPKKQVHKLAAATVNSFVPGSATVVDSLYGGFPVVEAMAAKGLSCVAKCCANRPTFLWTACIRRLLLQVKKGPPARSAEQAREKGLPCTSCGETPCSVDWPDSPLPDPPRVGDYVLGSGRMSVQLEGDGSYVDVPFTVVGVVEAVTTKYTLSTVNGVVVKKQKGLAEPRVGYYISTVHAPDAPGVMAPSKDRGGRIMLGVSDTTDKEGVNVVKETVKWEEDSIVGFYHKNAGFIDQANAAILEMLPNYRFNNWLTKHTMFLCNVAVHNSHMLFKKFSTASPSREVFLKDVCEVLSPQPLVPQKHELTKRDKSVPCILCKSNTSLACLACQASMCKVCFGPQPEDLTRANTLLDNLGAARALDQSSIDLLRAAIPVLPEGALETAHALYKSTPQQRRRRLRAAMAKADARKAQAVPSGLSQGFPPST